MRLDAAKSRSLFENSSLILKPSCSSAIFYFSLFHSLRSHERDLVERQDFASPLIRPISPIHDAPKRYYHSSSRRRLPLGMIPFCELSQIAVGPRDHDSTAIV